jgi:hypothetical protein
MGSSGRSSIQGCRVRVDNGDSAPHFFMVYTKYRDSGDENAAIAAALPGNKWKGPVVVMRLDRLHAHRLVGVSTAEQRQLAKEAAKR